MTRLDDIKAAIADLTPDDRLRLQEWLAELESNLFDDRIARDARSGKLDGVVDAAIADLRAGRTKPL